MILNPIEDSIPGKTGLHDQSVLWDVDLRFGHALQRLTAGRLATSPLWTCPASLVITTIHEATERLAVEPAAPCRYALRYGGASDDSACRRRDLLAV